MIGEASASSHSRFSGSNALSHVYIQYPPLRCHIPGRGVFSWKTAPYNPYVAPSSDPISEGPVLSIRYSLDLKLLAIQRSRHEIQIWIKETGDTFSQKCRSESESILGFFWTDCPTCDIVLVKTSDALEGLRQHLMWPSGYTSALSSAYCFCISRSAIYKNDVYIQLQECFALEFYSYNTESRFLRLVETKKLNISWYIYTHESRLVLLASGMQCKSFTGYQLSSAGIVRLPRFEMAMAKPEANNGPILAAEDVHLITVYGRIYCLQFDRVAMLLNLYRFYRDAVGSLPVYSNKIAVSVVDNVLLVHQVEAKVVIIYDIFADSQAPISAPLPLFLRGYSKANVASSQTTCKASGASESKNPSDTEVTIYGDQWNFLVPDLAISASSSVQLILEFLQRRRLEADKVKIHPFEFIYGLRTAVADVLIPQGKTLIVDHAKQLCLAIARTIILERKPVPMVALAIDSITGLDDSGKFIKQEPEGGTLNESYNRSNLSTQESDGSLKSNSHYLDPSIGKTERGYLLETGTSGGEVPPTGNDQLNSNASERNQSQMTASAATSTADLYTYVFAPVEEEMAGDGSYLTAIIVEFLRSASLEKLKVHPNTYVLMVQILARDERYAELGLFIMNKIIEPSKEVALQLLESGRRNLEIRKLGLGMLRQLSLHHDYVLLLVQDGHYLEALRYARKHKVNTVRPSLFLEAAYSSKDPQNVAAVLRFFCDFIPGFKSTSDHHTYHRLVSEMNS
ncbi:hypothetical protein DH2020_041646 [Rehmannia glutinosa]|uniref:Mic1 domain-containing protein n=1 Tax=Rehmannia glutinosa TaxID=99300 RepID=A0ABR0URM1_REHGL